MKTFGLRVLRGIALAAALLAGAITVLYWMLFFTAASHPVRQVLVPFGNPDEISTEIDEEKLTVFKQFIETLDIDDLGKGGGTEHKLS